MSSIIIDHYPIAPIAFLSDKVPDKDKKYLDDDSGLIIKTPPMNYGSEPQKAILALVLSTLGRKSSSFHQIEYEFESLILASQRMSLYLTTVVPAENSTSLLAKCILSGILAFDLSHKKAFHKEDHRAQKMRAFINGASQYFHEIMFNDIYGRCGDAWAQWKPMSETVYDWVTRHQFPELMIVPTSNRVNSSLLNAASNKLLYEIFDFSDLSYCGISTTLNKVVSERLASEVEL